MLYEPEIVISSDRAVLQRIADKQTLVSCWDASNDPEFMALFDHIRAFNQSADCDESLLSPLVNYVEKAMPEIDDIINGMNIRFNGYRELETWIGTEDDDISDEAIPHRDHPCVGIFFYFNEANLSTHCIPNEYAGEDTGHQTYPDADFSKACILPPSGIALIKLGEQLHCSPSMIPPDTKRIVMHARYDM